MPWNPLSGSPRLGSSKNHHAYRSAETAWRDRFVKQDSLQLSSVVVEHDLNLHRVDRPGHQTREFVTVCLVCTGPKRMTVRRVLHKNAVDQNPYPIRYCGHVALIDGRRGCDLNRSRGWMGEVRVVKST